MRKSVIGLAAVLALLMAAPTFAMDVTGMFSAGAYVGYGVGFGDAFEDYEDEFSKETSSLGLAFGGHFRYFFGPNMGITGGVDYQTWKFECEDLTDEDWDYPTKISAFEAAGTKTETTEHWIAITADFTYLISPEANTIPYLMAGPGMYIPSGEGSDSKIGFNAGLGVLHFFSPLFALDAGAKFHMIPSAYDVVTVDEDFNPVSTESKAITSVQAFVGFSYFFGKTE